MEIKEQPSFDVILTTHNRLELTIESITCLYQYTPSELFSLYVIDDSTDLTPQWFDSFCKEHSNCHYSHYGPDEIKTGNNSWKLGLEHAKSDIIVTLVNSAFVEPGWYAHSLGILKENPKIGCVGIKLLYRNGIIWCAGKTFVNSLPVHLGIGQPGHTNTYMGVVPSVNPSVGFFKREALEKSLDIDTYIGWRGFEDDDVCLSIRKNGWKIIYCGFSSAYHLESPTRLQSNPDKPKFWQEYNENMRRFLAKWQGSELLTSL